MATVVAAAAISVCAYVYDRVQYMMRCDMNMTPTQHAHGSRGGFLFIAPPPCRRISIIKQNGIGFLHESQLDIA